MNPDAIIDHLGLEPHPEGGWYRQTWIAESVGGERPAASCIYYLLAEGDESRRHRIDAAELWHFYLGDPLELRCANPGHPDQSRVLGPHLSAGQSPQLLVAARTWQQARSLGAFTLVGCTVSPAFEWRGFELAETPDA